MKSIGGAKAWFTVPDDFPQISFGWVGKGSEANGAMVASDARVWPARVPFGSLGRQKGSL